MHRRPIVSPVNAQPWPLLRFVFHASASGGITHRALATTATVTLGHGWAAGRRQHNTIFYAAWWCLLDKSTERQLLELITGLIGFYHCCKFWIIPYVYYVVVYGKSE
jgi:hypothetical protein